MSQTLDSMGQFSNILNFNELFNPLVTFSGILPFNSINRLKDSSGEFTAFYKIK